MRWPKGPSHLAFLPLLPSCLSFLLSFGSVFCLFLCVLSSWFLIHEKNNIKIFYGKAFF